MPQTKKKQRKQDQDDGQLRIEWHDLDALEPTPDNPKRHAIDDLRASIARFGFIDPGTVDERTGRVVVGHGRREALIAMRDAGEPPPRNIHVDGKKWLVPVLRGVRFKNQREASAYLIAHNRLTEVGGWDESALAKMMGELGGELSGTGWSEKQLVQFMASVNPTEVVEDDAPERPKRPTTKVGDLWILGDHMIVCGDSTDPAVVSRVMGDARAVLVNTDPPYGVNYGDIADSRKRAGKKCASYEPIENDDLDGAELQKFLEGYLRACLPHVSDTPAFYMWHPMLTQGTFFAAAAAADILIHRQIIWVKPSLILGRGDYHWRHELAFYGWIRGRRCPFYGERNQTSVWELGRENDKVHPTQKPVELFAIPMRNHTRVGEVCYEPFSGSGSQIIAGEQLQRVVRAVELDRGYCDVAVERWQNMSGKKARRAAS